MDEKQALERAREALDQGNKEAARKLLAEALRAHPRSETAWLWLSAVVDTPDQKRDCLERVLKINPQNELASGQVGHLSEMETRNQASSSAQSADLGTQPGEPRRDRPGFQARSSTYAPVTRPSDQQTPSKAREGSREKKAVLVALGAAAMVLVCGIVVVAMLAIRGDWLQLGSLSSALAPSRSPSVTGMAADYALTIADLPSGYDIVPRGAGVLASDSGMDTYSIGFQSRSNLLNLTGPVIVVNWVMIPQTANEIGVSAENFAKFLAQGLAVAGSLQPVSVSSFADEVVAFRFVPVGFSSDIPMIGYLYVFRRTNALVGIVVLGVDTARGGGSSTVTIKDCEFFASQVLLKIERDLRQG
jgi:hypothetical protein